MIDKNNLTASEFTSGLRAPSGIYLRSEKQLSLWITDHGPRGGDELNIGVVGQDFGWPHVSLGDRYFDDVSLEPGESLVATSFLNHAGYVPPIFSWTPSIAPSNISVLNDKFGVDTSWKEGDLLIGSLKAQSIFHIVVDELDRVRLVEQVQVGDRIRDISLNGRDLWYSTDDGQVVLLRKQDIREGNGMFPKSITPDRSAISRIPLVSSFFEFVDRVIRKL